MPSEDVDVKELRARNERLSELFATPADDRIREAVRLRAEMLRTLGISERHIVGAVAARMNLHRNTVYGYFQEAKRNPEKYGWK